MQIQDEAIELTANLTLKACRIYRQNFFRDLLQDMQNIYKTYNKSPFEGINFAGMDVEGKSEQEIYAQLLSRVDVTKLSELHTLTGEQTETGYQIVSSSFQSRCRMRITGKPKIKRLGSDWRKLWVMLRRRKELLDSKVLLKMIS